MDCESPCANFKPRRLAERIEAYWSARAEAFGKLRREELAGDKARLWLTELAARMPKGNGPLKILDVGAGAGFFSVLLAKAGHRVTGADISQKMLAEARRLAQRENCAVEFLQMDALAPEFPDGSFDCVVGRNIAWTLPDPEKAYREWLRVLKPGGMLINFDADYGRVDFAALRSFDGKHAHADLPEDLAREGERIRRELAISGRRRPQWDLQILSRIGFSDIFCDLGVSERVYAVRDATYNPVPMFAIGGKK